MSIANNPETVAQHFFKEAIRFHRDEQSGYSIADLAENRELSNTVLGSAIAPGLHISHLGSAPAIHLLKTSLDSTFSDFEATQSALVDSIKMSELVVGHTPSSKALRVFTLMLQHLPSVSSEDRSMLKNLRKEASTLDLNKPKDANWQYSTTLQIDGKTFAITVALQKVGTIKRYSTALFGQDIPKDQRTSRYCYSLSIRPTTPSKTEALRKLLHTENRVVGICGLCAPMAAVSWISGKVLPTTLLPAFTNNTALQTFAESTVHILPEIATIFATLAAVRYLQRKRAPKNSSLVDT